MKSRARQEFWTCFDALPAEIQKLTREAFALWQDNPRHPSLHFKSVHGTEPLYSVRVGKRWRALGLLERDTITWFWVGPHAEYDKVIRKF